MELWIRSQDKSNLKIVKDIYVEHIEKDFDSWVGNIYSQPYVITSDNGNLGFYATEERALEVLDEIQRKISQNECLKIMIPKLNNVKGEEENISELFKGMVYEMPKE